VFTSFNMYEIAPRSRVGAGGFFFLPSSAASSRFLHAWGEAIRTGPPDGLDQTALTKALAADSSLTVRGGLTPRSRVQSDPGRGAAKVAFAVRLGSANRFPRVFVQGRALSHPLGWMLLRALPRCANSPRTCHTFLTSGAR